MIASALLVCVAADAADDAPAVDDDAPVEVIVVTAAMADAGPQVATTVAADVARTGDRTVAGVLERNVAFTARTGGRGERIFALNGFDQRQVAVFIDGIPASVPYDGQVDLGKFPSSLIDTVEVAPGATAGLFGPNGLGGSVRIRTRAAPDYAEAQASDRGVGVRRRRRLRVGRRADRPPAPVRRRGRARPARIAPAEGL